MRSVIEETGGSDNVLLDLFIKAIKVIIK